MDDQINFRLNVRVFQGEQPFLGKGRVQLLERIEQLGSIAQAAKSMGMSYRKAWGLIKEMNTIAQAPLVEKQPGGKSGGGAVVTEAGKAAIQKYQQLMQALDIHLAQLAQEIRFL